MDGHSAKEERRMNRGHKVEPATYGELAPEGARRLGQHWGLCAGTRSATFADLGSGVGKLVVQSYLEWPGVKRALGVELSATRAKFAWEAWESLLISDEVHRPGEDERNSEFGKNADPLVIIGPFLLFSLVSLVFFRFLSSSLLTLLFSLRELQVAPSLFSRCRGESAGSGDID
eukprot:Skav214800  [mRNA]  locus=scaffold740:101049:110255:- [translate_table: standard]